ncbi:MAG: glycerophosphodiester phosphodiesterase [Methanohalobium sp.]|uniref:glycerophosphodiester phosphodiesterase n=1 Tax=Methanohalobium sp. TaxID=2837493 RepID=UPI00397B0DCE
MAVIGSILIVAIAPLFYGLTYMTFKGIKGEKVEINDIFEGFHHFVRSWIFAIIAGVLLFVGYIAFVIPGIILSILLIYALPLLVIKGYGGIDAIRESINYSRENPADTLVLFVIGVFISFAGGAIPFGFILSLPYTTILYTMAANNLIKEHEIHDIYPETEFVGG